MPLPFFNIQKAAAPYLQPSRPPVQPAGGQVIQRAAGLFGAPSATLQASRRAERLALQRELRRRGPRTPWEFEDWFRSTLGFGLPTGPKPTDPQGQIDYFMKLYQRGTIDQNTRDQRIKRVTRAGSPNILGATGQFAQGIARAIPTVGATVQQAITRKPTVLKPNRAGRVLFGNRPIQSIQEGARTTEEAHPGGFGVGPFTLSPKLTGAAYSGLSLGANLSMASPITRGALGIGRAAVGKTTLPKGFGQLATDEAGFARLPQGFLASSKAVKIKKTPADKIAESEKIRQFSETVRTSPFTPNEYARTIKAMPLKTRVQKPIIERAYKDIKKDPWAAFQEAKKPLNIKQNIDYQIAKRQLLLGFFAKNKYHDLADEVLKVAAPIGSELGQGIAMFGAFSRTTPTGIYSYAKQLGASNDIASGFFKRASEIPKIKDPYKQGAARAKLAEDAGRLNPSPRAQQIVDVWRSLLLTAPTTPLGSILGNVQEAIQLQGLVKPTAAALDIGIAGAGKGLKKLGFFKGSEKVGQRSITYNPLDVGGYTAAFGRKVKELPAYLKTGYDPRLPLAKYEAGQVRYGTSKSASAGRKVSQGIYRMMGATDQPFWYGAERVALKDMARIVAKNQGLKGAERQKFMEDFMTKGTVQAKAAEEANYSVFANPTVLGKRGGQAANWGWPMRATLPFTKIPASVGTRIFVDRSPIGIVKTLTQLRPKKFKAGEFDQRAFTQELANGIVGTTEALVLGKYLADKNLITLGYPSSESERKRWELEGKQPYSIRVGNKYLSLNYVQPFGGTVAWGARLAQAKKEGEDWSKSIGLAAGTAAKSLTSQSFLQGVGRSTAALQEPEQNVGAYVESASGSIIPNILRSVARSTDKTQRQVEDVGEALMTGIPGLRQKLTPRQNVFGEDIPRPSSFWDSLFNPLRPSKVRGDELSGELRRLADAGQSVMPPAIKKDFYGKDKNQALTKENIYAFNQTIGPAIKQRWQKTINEQGYKALPDEYKRKVLSGIAEEAKRQFKASGKIGEMDDYIKKQQEAEYDDRVIKPEISSYQNKVKGDSRYQSLSDRNKEDVLSSISEAVRKQIKANGKVGELKDYVAVQAKQQRSDELKAQYDSRVLELYKLNKTKLRETLANDPNRAELERLLLEYDRKRTDSGFIKKPKYKNGLYPSR